MRQLFMKETLTAVTCVIWQMCFHLLVWTLTHFWVGYEVPQASPNKGAGTQFWNCTFRLMLCFHSPRWKGHFYVHSWGCFCIFRCWHLFITLYPLFGLSVTHTEQCYEPLCNLCLCFLIIIAIWTVNPQLGHTALTLSTHLIPLSLSLSCHVSLASSN